MPKRDEVLTMRLTEQRKAEWESYVEEEADSPSLSHFIRIAVQEKINRMEKEDSGVSTSQGSSESEVSPQLTQGIEDIQNTLTDLGERMSAIEGRFSTLGKGDNVNLLYEMLPPSEPHTEEWETLRSGLEDIHPDHRPFSIYGTPEELGELLDSVDAESARNQLRTIAHSSEKVHTKNVDGKEVFWRDA